MGSVTCIAVDKAPKKMMTESDDEETGLLKASRQSSTRSTGSRSKCMKCNQLESENLTLKAELLELRKKEASIAELDHLYSISATSLALRRVPALLVTLALELMGGIVIDALSSVIQKYVLIASFMPTISALSGNLGLQASSNMVRGLGTGHVVPDQYCYQIWKEVRSGVVSSMILSSVMAIISIIWSFIQDKDIIADYPEHPWLFGAVIFLGCFISMMVSTVNGVGTPIMAVKCNLDPSKIAGPLETAFQDIVGQSFLLGVGYLVFHSFESFKSP